MRDPGSSLVSRGTVVRTYFLMEKHQTLMFVLLFITVCSNGVSGSPCAPYNLKASGLDGEVTVVWDPPRDVTSLARYSVQMSEYNARWLNVSDCTMIQAPLCDLSSLIVDYMRLYRVRVHTVTANGVSEWAVLKKVLPNDSKLRPPSFTLLATSSSLTVTVDEKPVLRKLSPFGITYTIYLEENGGPNETTMAYLNDDNEGLEGRRHTFRSLHWGREYCVRLQVEGNTGLQQSNVSTQQCVLLPEPEWYKIAVPSASVLGVLAVLAIIMSALCSFLRQPEKTPLALKSPERSWSPLMVWEGRMEVVTDTGWLLCVPKAPPEGWGNTRPRALDAFVPETEWKSERRTSLDSGVSVGSDGAMKPGGSDPARLEDSGCASSGGSRGAESFGGAVEEDSPRAGRNHVSAEGKTGTGDVGVCGRGPPLLYSSSSDGQDSGIPPEQTHLVDPYRHQGRAAVRLETCDGDRPLKEVRVDPDWSLVDAVTTYRKGQLSCAGQMNAELSGEQPTFSTNYRRKTHIQMETVVSVEDSEPSSDRTCAAFEDASPTLFLPITFLPSAGVELGCGVNAVAISLSDVELWGE